MKRQILIFDKKTEALKYALDLTIPNSDILAYYKEFVQEDSSLIYEYEISNKDVAFYKQYMTIDFDFDKNDYFLSCSES